MAIRDFMTSVKNWLGPKNSFFNGSQEPETGSAAAIEQAQNAFRQQQDERRQEPRFDSNRPQQPQQTANVYSTPSYQAPQPGTMQTQQPAPQPNGYVPPQSQQPVAQPQRPAPMQEAKLPNVCIINTRNLDECRNAIQCIRQGDIVVAVMDSIADQNELRRYVDMLSGAAFTLNGAMMRLSARGGVYLISPPGVRAFTDQSTSQLNAQPSAARGAAANYGMQYNTQPYNQNGGVYAPPTFGQQQYGMYAQSASFMTQQTASQGYSPDAGSEYNNY